MNTLVRDLIRAAMSVVVALTTLAPSAPAQNLKPTPLDVVADTPAATLLLPYFEVDLRDSDGMTTSFTVDNTLPFSVLARVTLWSDLGVPVFNFNVYLTGYDVQAINLRDVLAGRLPQTASTGQDPNDTISPKGPWSQDINYASCAPLNIAPQAPSVAFLPPLSLPASIQKHLVAALTGQPSGLWQNQCASLPHGDHIARGYVTVDTANNCTRRTPDDPNYFNSGFGDLTNQNYLTGEAFYIDPEKQVARSEKLVHVHADGQNPLTSTLGNYTFYGRNVGFTAADNRQPLATNYAARFLRRARGNGEDLFTGGASLVVWRDPKVPQPPFACGTTPSWYPLAQESITAFDEQEHPQSIPSAVLPFPAATQQVKIGGAQLPVSFDSGWLWLDLKYQRTRHCGPFHRSECSAGMGLRDSANQRRQHHAPHWAARQRHQSQPHASVENA